MKTTKQNAKRMTRRWTPAELAYVEKHFEQTSKEIAKALKGRTPSAVQAKIEILQQ